MKRSRFTLEQISFALKSVETGEKVSDVCRKPGISDATFYNWRKKYGGLDSSDRCHLKELKDNSNNFIVEIILANC